MAIEFLRCKGCNKGQRSDRDICQFCGAEILTGVMPPAKIRLNVRIASILNAGLIFIREWLSRPKSKKIVASCAIITLLLGGVLYWRWVRSPQYSIWQVIKAFEQHDFHTFEKYVDIEGFSSRLIDQVLEQTSSRSPESTDAWSKLGEALAGGIFKMAKPKFITMMKEQVRYYVEKGNFETAKQGKEDQDTPVNIKDVLNRAKTKFKGVEYTKKDGKIALVGLRIFYPEYKSSTIIDVKMRDLGDYWQVAELSNLNNFLETMEMLRLPIIDAEAKRYKDQGKYTEAETLFKRSLAIFEKNLGPEHFHVARTLVSLAKVYSKQGKYAEAETLFKRSLAIFEKKKNMRSDRSNVAIVLELLAMVSYNQNNYAEAETFYKRSLAIIEKTLRPDDPVLEKLRQSIRDNNQKAEAEAARWYREAADQGHADAQTELGVMYFTGEGVTRDYAEAVRWYRKAADQGYAIAQTSLALLYDNGLGVAKDYVQAHMWYSLAVAQGKKNARERRDSLAEKMTPAQIAEAQKLAREWKPKGK